MSKSNIGAGVIVLVLSATLSSQSVFSGEVTNEDIAAAKASAQSALKNATSAYEAQKKQQSSGVRWEMMPKPQAEFDQKNAVADVQANSRMLNNIMAQTNASALNQDGIKGIVFISFSMPDVTIRSYMDQASKVNNGKTIKLTIRGLDDSGSLIKTQKHIAKLMKGINAEVDIDPPSFDRFKIDKVPAIVFYKDNQLEEASCAVKGEKLKEGEYLKLYGDVPIDYAINHFLKDKRKSASFAEALIPMRDSIEGKI